jgi:alpha 1,2-mannosyltransferase
LLSLPDILNTPLQAGNNGLNLAALHLAAYMQADHAFWFRLCGGDKDTFRWAFRALDLPFAVSPMWAVPVGQRNGYENARFCGQ